MKKRNSLAIIIIVSILLIGGIYYMEKDKKGNYSKFKHISTKEIFLNNYFDKMKLYYVYFYRKDCPDCQKIESQIIDFANNYDVYFINTRDDNPDTKINSFNWSKCKTDNDIEIGIVNQDNNIEYYDGESKEKYISSTEVNKYDKVKKYEIVVADEKYLELNKNAKIGFAYASLLTPEINYSEVGIHSSIELAGVPTLLKINGYDIENYYYDSNDIIEYINSLK